MKLGERQEAVLRSLREYGRWHQRCGWVWDSASGTERILETLIRRGLVRKRKCKVGFSTLTVYYPKG
jgi:hypothetical protein